LNPTATTLGVVLRALKRDAEKRIESGEKPLVALGELINEVPFAALVADDHGRYVLANARAAGLTEYSERELRRLSVWDLTPSPAKHDFEVLWRAFIEQGEQRGRYKVVTKTGSIVTADYAARANVLPHLHVSVLRRRERSARQEGMRTRRTARDQ
jgi:PAS domain S-box-containing protein